MLLRRLDPACTFRLRPLASRARTHAQNNRQKSDGTVQPSSTQKGGGHLSTVGNATIKAAGHCEAQHCNETIILPYWYPDPHDISIGIRCARAVVLLVALMYIFIGLSLISDRFYGAIDTIVSQKRKVKIISRITGSAQYVLVPVWNETVAHLTLFVAGTSAPEILLSMIEMILSGFKVGELAPMVILGSAFNLFVTAAICVVSVKNGKSKKLEEIGIFLVTAFFAVFSYIWLYLIIVPFSDGVIEPWEAILTLGFYPIEVVIAYMVDKHCFGACRCLAKLRSSRVHVAVGRSSSPSNDSSTAELGVDPSSEQVELESLDEVDEVEAATTAAEQRQNRFLKVLKQMRAKHPNKTSAQIQTLAELEIVKEMPKSMGYYRMLASKSLSGGGEVINKEKLRQKFEKASTKRFDKPNQQIIYFDPTEYKVMEDCGSFEVNVVREGRYLKNTVAVDYATEDGTGIAGSDYKAAQGKLVFPPDETLKCITLEIIDDDVFNIDTTFFVNLTNPHVVDRGEVSRKNPMPELKLDPARATITKIDDDHGGVFHFERATATFEEDIGEASITVLRSSGAKGCVAVPYKIVSETAKPGLHYEDNANKHVLIFPNRVTEQVLTLTILNEERMAKNVALRVELGQPYFADPNTINNQQQQPAPSKAGAKGKKGKAKPPPKRAQVSKNSKNKKGAPVADDKDIDTSKLGKPKLGDLANIVVSITENTSLRSAIDNMASFDINEFVGSTSWKQQFADAVTVVASSNNDDEDEEDDDDGDEEGNIKPEEDNQSTTKAKPSCKDYAFHIATVFWKILFAFIPPSGVWGGWAGFLCCLIIIGTLMGLAGDVAVMLGCTIGMNIELTAITLIALGVSLPDMFSSRLAAMREETADAAIGHMSGRIGVNVFVGIGLTWSIASIKQAIEGKQLIIKVKQLSFTIVLFFVCAAIAVLVLFLRRFPPIRGELGGPPIPRTLTGLLLFALWVIYVILSGLDSFCVISTNF